MESLVLLIEFEGICECFLFGLRPGLWVCTVLVCDWRLVARKGHCVVKIFNGGNFLRRFLAAVSKET